MICTLSALIYPKQISASTLFKLCLNLHLNPELSFFLKKKKKSIYMSSVLCLKNFKTFL